MLELRIGDTFQQTATISDDTDAPYDLLDCTLWFTVKRRISDLDANAVAKLYWVSGGASDGITVADPVIGEATIQLSPAQTAEFVQAAYQYDLQLKDFSGLIHTIDHGVLVAKRSATMRTTTP